ncbi:MAG: TPM domain-containing protein [Cyanobacteria bacterium]|nr:TPM domain-containing protein [Cyanobacteriota bacterium]
MRLLNRLLAVLTALVIPLLVAAPVAWAVGVRDLPTPPASQHLIDTANLFSRSTSAELEHRLADLESDHVQARLLTVPRLDYGLELEALGQQELEAWSSAEPSEDSELLVLIDAQTNTAAVVASPDLLEQLPASLLHDTADSTMAVPLRLGIRYRQASLDALDRLSTVLHGGEDPGPPLQETAAPVVTNIPTREETANSNGFQWVIVLLAVGTIVPMLTWWVFSR